MFVKICHILKYTWLPIKTPPRSSVSWGILMAMILGWRGNRQQVAEYEWTRRRGDMRLWVLVVGMGLLWGPARAMDPSERRQLKWERLPSKPPKSTLLILIAFVLFYCFREEARDMFYHAYRAYMVSFDLFKGCGTSLTIIFVCRITLILQTSSCLWAARAGTGAKNLPVVT